MTHPLAPFRPIGLIFAFAGFLAPIIPVIKNLGLAPLGVVCALAGLWVIMRGGAKKVELDRSLWGVIAMVLLWQAASALWSLDPIASLEQTARFGANMAIGFVLLYLAKAATQSEISFAGKALWVGFLAAVGFVGLDILLGGPISSVVYNRPDIGPAGYFWYNSAGSVFSVLAWPVALVALRQGMPMLGGAALALAVLSNYLIDSKSALLAALVGIGTAGVTWLARGWGPKVIGAFVAIAVLASPVLPLTVLQPLNFGIMGGTRTHALLHRLYIWEFAAHHALEKPALGWGMDASRRMPGGRETIVDPRYGIIGHAMPLHPHNTSLQVWLELGLPGALLTAALAFLIFRRIGQGTEDRTTRALWTGQAVATITLAHLSFGAWQSWWISLIWISIAFSMMVGRAKPTSETNPEPA